MSKIVKTISMISLVFVLLGCSAQTSLPQQPTPELIVPEYLELLEVGMTYQLEPVCVGVDNPIYSYVSESKEVLEISEEGLITVHGTAIMTVWVNVRDLDSDIALTKEIVVYAGDMPKQPFENEEG